MSAVVGRPGFHGRLETRDHGREIRLGLVDVCLGYHEVRALLGLERGLVGRLLDQQLLDGVLQVGRLLVLERGEVG